jgi:hypothetical protein
MHAITVVTFKGCQSTIDFRNQVDDRIDRGAIEAQIDLLIVQSRKDAAQLGLHGAPTILIDGVEYQKERRGPAGFYCRAYATAEGYRPFPLPSEIVAALGGAAPCFPRPPPGPLGELPALVVADWCMTIMPSVRFWREAAAALELPLQVLDAESDEGARLTDAALVAGVPCAIAGPGRLMYGDCTVEEARQFLAGAAPGSGASAA